MKRALWLLVFLVGCESKRDAPKPLSVSLPSAANPTPAPVLGLFSDIYRRRVVPPGTDTNVDRVETALAKHPKDTNALKAVGLAYYAAGGYEAAIKRLTGLTDPEAQLYLGFAQMGLNHDAEALTALKKAKGAVALMEQGNLYFQVLKKDEEAEKCFTAALVGEMHGEAALALGLLQASHGKVDAARKFLRDASETLPGGKARAAAFAALGRLESDPDKARAWYEKTRKDDPENPWLKKLSK